VEGGELRVVDGNRCVEVRAAELRGAAVCVGGFPIKKE